MPWWPWHLYAVLLAIWVFVLTFVVVWAFGEICWIDRAKD